MELDPSAPFPRKDRFVTPWKDILSTEPPEMLVEHMVPKGQVTWLYGKTGIGKSLLVSAIAQSIAYGEQVFGAYETKQANVLWLDYENGIEVHKERLENAMFLLDDVAGSGIYQIGTFPESLSKDNATDLLYEIGKYDIGLLVIDSAGVGIDGDSNSADTYADFAAHVLNPLKKLGITVIILDNMGKDSTRGAIGSSRKTHEAAVVWELKRRGDSFTLEARKRRVQGIVEAIGVQMQTDPLRFMRNDKTIDADPDMANIAIFLDALHGARWMTVRELKQAIVDEGFKMRGSRIQEAIKWWNKGEHDAVE